MAFPFRLKADAKCVYRQSNWITVANYFGTHPADWVHEYLYFEPGAWIWTKRFRRYLHIVKNWSGIFFFKFNQGTCPWMAFAWNFFGIFLIKKKKNLWGGSVGQIISREYIVFRGSNISCSLAWVSWFTAWKVVSFVWKAWKCC